MKIAGEFQAEEWSQLVPQLNADEEDAWKKATDILRDRLSGRYLEQARELLSKKYSGFAVLTIDCAVIEALEQFRKGKASTPPGNSENFFVTFLTTTRFKNSFNEDKAKLFYKTIRCGILHQAESKEDSLVKKSDANFIVETTPSGNGIIINAKSFHEELEKVFEEYIAALLDGDDALRNAFIEKMGHITRSQQQNSLLIDITGNNP